MRIRLPFAGVFFLLLLLAGYAGLTSLQLGGVVGDNDKVLHLLTFFLLTVAFYWIIDTNRRRTLNLTLIVCTAVLGVGSEFLQAVLPNDRKFDVFDLVANVVGSLAGLGLCSWYHKRMLERKRMKKSYTAVPGEDDEDLELGEGVGLGAAAGGGGVDDGHEEGVMVSGALGDGAGVGASERATTLEDEVDNWDENAVDAWDENDGGDVGEATSTSAKGKAPEANGDHIEPKPKKRTD